MRITTTKRFDKMFIKQTSKTQQEFGKRIDLLLENLYTPILNTHKLTGKMDNMWSFNVSGDTRVIFRKSADDSIMLAAIGSHSELYG